LCLHDHEKYCHFRQFILLSATWTAVAVLQRYILFSFVAVVASTNVLIFAFSCFLCKSDVMQQLLASDVTKQPIINPVGYTDTVLLLTL